MNKKETMENLRLLRLETVHVSTVIAAAYHIAGRTVEDARKAILDALDKPHLRSVPLLTVGELYSLTNWQSIDEIQK